MFLEFWCKMRDGLMDFKGRAVDLEVQSFYHRAYPEDSKVFYLTDGYLFTVDSRLQLKAVEEDVSKVDTIILTLDQYIVKITVETSPDNDSAYVFGLTFGDRVILTITHIYDSDTPNLILKRFALKQGYFEVADEERHFKTTFKIEVFKDEYF
jgi:hypothetical protein